VASRRKAGKAQVQAQGSLAGLRACQSKAVVEHPRSSAAEHRLQPAPVRVSVSAAQSEASRARRLRVLVPVKDKAQKNADNRESIDLRPHRLPVQVQGKHEVEEREGRVRMVNLAANQEAERLLLLSAGKGSRSAERKKARGPHRRADHNSFRRLFPCYSIERFYKCCSNRPVAGQRVLGILVIIGRLTEPWLQVCG
jgi:hypothetical protein